MILLVKYKIFKLFNNTIALTKRLNVNRNISDSELNYKILYFIILDNILFQINARFQNTDKSIFLELTEISKFKRNSNISPKNPFENLGGPYSDIFVDRK